MLVLVLNRPHPHAAQRNYWKAEDHQPFRSDIGSIGSAVTLADLSSSEPLEGSGHRVISESPSSTHLAERPTIVPPLTSAEITCERPSHAPASGAFVVIRLKFGPDGSLLVRIGER